MALVAALGLAVRMLAPAPTPGPAAIASAHLDSALVAWTVTGPAEARLFAAYVPSRPQRDWLVALQRTGTSVTWTLEDTTAAAMVVEPVAAPRPASRIVAVASPGRSIDVADAAGSIDSAVIGDAGALALQSTVTGVVRARLGSSRPTSTRRDSLLLRPVLVLGRAGWESKFTIAALEEDGWTVRARLSVAPGASVVQGAAGASLDTAVLSAVVVLDSASAPSAAALRRFVEQGGGVVAAGGAMRAASIRAVLPVRGSPPRPGVPGALDGPDPRAGLVARTLSPTRPEVVPLERRGVEPVVVAMRIQAGRAVAVGYDDTWRWRMLGAADAPEAHRAWWSALVSSVAHAPALPLAHPPVDEAPLAAAIASLGPPAAAGATGPGGSNIPTDAILFTLVLGALLGEWISRRLRGRP